MLECLHIENIAVIERADIQFRTGFTALTGETGAGKSIVIDAINAVLGERTRRDLVRTGSETAHITALFNELSLSVVEQLENLGYPPDEDGNLLIGRTISAEGKGSCTVNGRPATASLLREIGKLLVDLHGQHENQALLSPETHLAYLDRFGGLEEQRYRYEEAYHAWRKVCRELQQVDIDETEKARRMDLLRYQIEEIEAANLTVGEEEEIAARRSMYRNAEKIASRLAEAKSLLFGNDGTEGALSLGEQAVSSVNSASRYMEKATEVSEQLQNALYEFQAAAEEVKELASLLEFDPREADEVENRFEVLRRLFSKYGSTTEEVLSFCATAQEQLQQIELSDEHIQRLTEQEQKLHAVACREAEQLTAKRRETALTFSQAVGAQLAFLDMPNVSLQIDCHSAPLSVTGADMVEFLMSANIGEPAKPITRIASGGELSRIMLAIKSVLADADEIDTLIFDEIDTGISGKAAQKVGLRLRQTAESKTRRRQVLCVTHLAQIAARAQQHFLINKTIKDGRTYTQVTPLSEQEREQELARIIGGTVTPANLQAAKEMLQN